MMKYPNVVAWLRKDTLFFSGTSDQFADIYAYLGKVGKGFEEFVYLGKDPEMKWMTGEKSLEEIIKENGYTFEDGHVKVEDYSSAKEAYEELKDWNIPIVYLKNGEEKEYTPLRKKAKRFLIKHYTLLVSGILIGSIFAIDQLMKEPVKNPKIEELSIHEAYGFTNNTYSPSEKVEMHLQLSNVPQSGNLVYLVNHSLAIPLLKIKRNPTDIEMIVNQTNYSVNGIQYVGHLHGKYWLDIETFSSDGQKVCVSNKTVSIYPPPQVNISLEKNKTKLVFFSKDKYFLLPNVNVEKNGKWLATFVPEGDGWSSNPSFLENVTTDGWGNIRVLEIPNEGVTIFLSFKEVENNSLGLKPELKLPRPNE